MQREYLKKLDGPILLRGDYFKAVLTAYSDFSGELTKKEAAGTLQTLQTGNSQLGCQKLRITTYTSSRATDA